MSGLVAHYYGLQGLLLAVQDEPGFQGASLVMPIGCEGLLQEETLRDGQRQGVPGMEKGEWVEAINMTGRVRAQLELRAGLSQRGERQDTHQPCVSPTHTHLPFCHAFVTTE